MENRDIKKMMMLSASSNSSRTKVNEETKRNGQEDGLFERDLSHIMSDEGVTIKNLKIIGEINETDSSMALEQKNDESSLVKKMLIIEENYEKNLQAV
jgi:hypothetical protein